MPAMEIGRICVKTAGREAGKKCVIVDILDKNFVLITGPKLINKVKRRRANIKQLEPTSEKIEIEKGAADKEIEQQIDAAGKREFMLETIKIQ
ncbi:MAG: 50S ribosomal protein L14e [Candidatus Helarchaeota archaeon]|nr:50S ribosomal protein L14e [Candidatus Helarchaeota archaeon]